MLVVATLAMTFGFTLIHLVAAQEVKAQLVMSYNLQTILNFSDNVEVLSQSHNSWECETHGFMHNGL